MPPGGRSGRSTPRSRRHQRPPGPPSDDPREEDVDAFGDATRECPECKASLYDDAEVCYRCGHSLSASSEKHPPVWVLVVIGLVLAAIVVPWLMRIF